MCDHFVRDSARVPLPLPLTVTVQHRLLPRVNVSWMYAECFDKVFYHVNSRILKCKMTNVITRIKTQFNNLKRRHEVIKQIPCKLKLKVTKKITCRFSTPTSQKNKIPNFESRSSIRSQNEHKRKLDDYCEHQDLWEVQDSKVINHITQKAWNCKLINKGVRKNTLIVHHCETWSRFLSSNNF